MVKSLEDLKKFIKIAEEMLKKDEIDTCINRLYILCENAAELILSKYSGELPKRHDKIANALENLFKTGKIGQDFSDTLRRLYELHLLSDYGKAAGKEPSSEEVGQLFDNAKHMLEAAGKQ